ncbi:MAG TPA: hypothetical protein PLY40_03450 [Bacillota bacterium]|nr:hypothetical protein [Bacillota bacterium]
MSDRQFDTLFFSVSSGASLLFVAVMLFTGNRVAVENFSLAAQLAAVAACVILYAIAVKLLFVYQIWSALPAGTARVTPLQAAGFLLIPLFNLYWVFVALPGFCRLFNRYREKKAPGIPKLPETLFLAYGFVWVLVPVAAAVVPSAALTLAAAGWIIFILIVLETGRALNWPAGAAPPAGVQNGGRGRIFFGLPATRPRLYGFIFASLVLTAVIILALLPRARFRVEQFTVPEEVVAGDPFTASTIVYNYGRAPGQYELAVFVEGVKSREASVSLAAGGKKKVLLTMAGISEPGSYRISLGLGKMQKVSRDFEQVVRILKPAKFVISHLSLQPRQINLGEEATARVRVTNAGEAEGSYEVELAVDGVVEQTKRLVLEGESTEEITFFLEPAQPGPCTIEVNGLSETLEVFQLERPVNGAILVNKITGGFGRLTVINNRHTDAMVMLTLPEEPQTALLALYVHARSTAHAGGIKDGSYIIYFSEGTDWDSYGRRFTRNVSYHRFDTIDRFDTVHSSGGYTYTILTIEFGLREPVEEPAAIKPVEEEQFPAIF